MDIESLRKYCMSFPHSTEGMQWESGLVFKIGGKMFAVINLAPAPESILSFKCKPEVFADLVERDGIMPAHYVGRYHWVSLERLDAVSPKELKELIGQSYNIVFEKLPKKVRGQLETE
jgi:predicted DNA-binding protein (MmcQ/YjbR family)